MCAVHLLFVPTDQVPLFPVQPCAQQAHLDRSHFRLLCSLTCNSSHNAESQGIMGIEDHKTRVIIPSLRCHQRLALSLGCRWQRLSGRPFHKVLSVFGLWKMFLLLVSLSLSVVTTLYCFQPGVTELSLVLPAQSAHTCYEQTINFPQIIQFGRLSRIFVSRSRWIKSILSILYILQ